MLFTLIVIGMIAYYANGRINRVDFDTVIINQYQVAILLLLYCFALYFLQFEWIYSWRMVKHSNISLGTEWITM